MVEMTVSGVVPVVRKAIGKSFPSEPGYCRTVPELVEHSTAVEEVVVTWGSS
jgi:hypothetical protein